jgi:hypothetical protein
LAPPLALPSLAAYIRQMKHDVRSFDLNLRAFQYILDKDNLQSSFDYVKKEYDRYTQMDQLSIESLDHYQMVIRNTLAGAELIANIGDALQVYKEPNLFIDYQQYQWATKVIQKALILGMSRYYPTKVNMFDAQSKYSDLSSSGLIQAALEKEEFYVAFYQEFLAIVCTEKPDLVGITVCAQKQIIPAMILASMIKEYCKDTHVLMGGSYISENHLQMTQRIEFYDYCDGLIINEGELALGMYLEYLKGQVEITDIPNLLPRRRDF